VDIPNYVFKTHFSLLAIGNLSDRNSPGIPVDNIMIHFDYQGKSFKAGEILQQQDITMTLSEGDIINFPFDVYFGDFYLAAEITGTNATNPG